jgi:hypothetical protein
MEVAGTLVVTMNNMIRAHELQTEIAGNSMEILLDITGFTPRDDYTMDLVFENGEKRIFDMTLHFSQKPYTRLSGSSLFFKASVRYGTVVWPGNIDIAPETLLLESTPA